MNLVQQRDDGQPVAQDAPIGMDQISHHTKQYWKYHQEHNDIGD